MTQPTTTISLVITFPISSAHGLAFGLGGGLRDIATWLAEAARREIDPLGAHTIEPVPGHPLTFTIAEGSGQIDRVNGDPNCPHHDLSNYTARLCLQCGKAFPPNF